jgi:hypothetical protein
MPASELKTYHRRKPNDAWRVLRCHPCVSRPARTSAERATGARQSQVADRPKGYEILGEACSCGYLVE